MSSFFIVSMAVIARFAPSEAESLNHSDICRGTTCQDTPNWSFSHPHCWALGSPPADSFSQYASISACVSQWTSNEIASLNLKCGPPFRAVNR